MEKIVIKKPTYRMFPDKENGIIYCTGRGVFIIDMNTAKAVQTVKSVSYANQILWDEKYLIVKSTVGEFAVFNKHDLTLPVWKFKLKKIGNTDDDFLIRDKKLYGYNSDGKHTFFIIDIPNKVIASCQKSEFPHGILSELLERAGKKFKKWQAGKKYSTCNLSGDDIPQKYEDIPYVSCYFETDKFEFIGSWENLQVVPKQC